MMPTPGPASRRRPPQGHDTVVKIRTAAVHVFRRAGYGPARVDDIVKEADVSHGTFYLYFRNKDELFRTIAAHVASRAGHLVRELDLAGASESELLHLLYRWFVKLLALTQEYGPVLGGWLTVNPHDPVLSTLANETFEDLAARLAQGVRDPFHDLGEDPLLPGMALATMITRFCANIASDGEPVDAARIARSLTEVVATVLTVGRASSTLHG